jgi:hypothetical protein
MIGFTGICHHVWHSICIFSLFLLMVLFLQHVPKSNPLWLVRCNSPLFHSQAIWKSHLQVLLPVASLKNLCPYHSS